VSVNIWVCGARDFTAAFVLLCGILSGAVTSTGGVGTLSVLAGVAVVGSVPDVSTSPLSTQTVQINMKASNRCIVVLSAVCARIISTNEHHALFLGVRSNHHATAFTTCANHT
jgi:hypothetical protein